MMADWTIKHNPRGGFIVRRYEYDREVGSFPVIEKWYWRWLYPYAILRAVHECRKLRP
jgi:hypothetical protein